MLGEIYRMLVLNPENLLRNSPGHAKTQAENRSRQKEYTPAIILSGIRGRRFEEQLCHADERSEPRLGYKLYEIDLLTAMPMIFGKNWT